MRILSAYKNASGQEVNLSKLGIMFSKNTSEVDRKASIEILSISRLMESDSYLGRPLMFGRNKAKELRFIKDRVWQKIQSWGARLLSYVGKAVMFRL